MIQLFNQNNLFYKGNLHTHTTLSDGEKSPEEAIALYKDAGYDFLCITDHHRFSPQHSVGNLLVLGGLEFDLHDVNRPHVECHIIGVGLQKEITTKGLTTQTFIDTVNEQGGMAILAHPVWSFMQLSDILPLKGLYGMEIYNRMGDRYCGRGDSTAYADLLSKHDMDLRLFAVDDVHFYGQDAACAHIRVNAPSLTWADLREALIRKRFYACETAQSPRILQINFDETTNEITVETSPCTRIIFMSNLLYEMNRFRFSSESTLTKARYRINPKDQWVRIQCENAFGRTWTSFFEVNPISNPK